MKTKVFTILMVALMVVSPLSACSSKKSTGSSAPKVNVTFRLNYYASGLHAPFYAALSKGYYASEGLNVTIGEGTGAGTTAKLIGNASDTFGFVDAGTEALAVTQGVPIKVVCPIYSVNAFAAIALSSSTIKSIKDLEGKKVGITTGDAPQLLFQAVAKANNVDMSKITFVSMASTAKVPALANNQVDAILGGADAQSIQLKQLGSSITELRYSDNGCSTIGLSIVANNNLINTNPDLVKKFVDASLKGWDYARTHEDEVIQIEQKYVTTIKADQAKQELDVALSCLFAKDSTSIGQVSVDGWKNTISILQNFANIDKTFPVDAFYTNNCLPANLPKK